MESIAGERARGRRVTDQVRGGEFDGDVIRKKTAVPHVLSM